MSELLDNAVASIQLGVEDFQNDGDPRRILTAVRNLHAGVLLLCKEVLLRLSPPDSSELHIRSKQVATKKPSGAIVFQGTGKHTVNEDQIKERFKNLGIKTDLSTLKNLSTARNDIEHYYSMKPRHLMREAFAAALPIIRDVIVRELMEEPAALLGSDCWKLFLEQSELYEEEADRCINSFAKIIWKSNVLYTACDTLEFKCPECGSALLRQKDKNNEDEERIEFVCTQCMAKPEREEVIETAIHERLFGEEYLAITDGGDPPIIDCPECGYDSYIIEEGRCAVCGFVHETQKCGVCGKSLSVEDYANGSGLCSYHAHISEKERDK